MSFHTSCQTTAIRDITKPSRLITSIRDEAFRWYERERDRYSPAASARELAQLNREKVRLAANNSESGANWYQPPPTRCGSEKEYSTTTAPAPSKLHGAQSGGTTSRIADCGLAGVTFTRALSRASASTPSKQE